jgi:hypothetical protein
MRCICHINVKMRCAAWCTICVKIYMVHVDHLAASTHPTQQFLCVCTAVNSPSHATGSACCSAPAAHALVLGNDCPLVGDFLRFIAIIYGFHIIDNDYFFIKSKTYFYCHLLFLFLRTYAPLPFLVL